MWSVKPLGGIAMIQSHHDAGQPQMPKNVMEYVKPDYILPAAEMGAVINHLLAEPAPGKIMLPEDELKKMEMEVIMPHVPMRLKWAL